MERRLSRLVGIWHRQLTPMPSDVASFDVARLTAEERTEPEAFASHVHPTPDDLRGLAGTLSELASHLERQGKPPKIVVWAHNSHLGDARATGMVAEGELNLGQLVRERYGRDAILIGQTTNSGTVTAATDWDEPAQQRRVRPALPGSYEALLHEAAADKGGKFWLPLRDGGAALDPLRKTRLERAIGVIYRPETERFSHYFPALLPDQFDAVLHFDETSALQPLDPDPGWETPEELPETFPFGV